jgi:hypothetical protein
MRRRSWVLTVCLMLIVGSTIVDGAGAGAIPASACTRVVVVGTFAFGPGTVRPGGTATARLAGMNCTKHAQTVTLTWEGRYSAGAANGCPIIDPLVQAVSVAARTALAAHLAFAVPEACTAKLLTVTVRVVEQSGATLANKTAELRIAHKRSRST